MKGYVFTQLPVLSGSSPVASYVLRTENTSTSTLSLTNTLSVVSEVECLSTKLFTLLHQVPLKMDDTGLEGGWPESRSVFPGRRASGCLMVLWDHWL